MEMRRRRTEGAISSPFPPYHVDLRHDERGPCDRPPDHRHHPNREDEWKPDELIETLQALDRLRKALPPDLADFPTRLPRDSRGTSHAVCQN